MGTKKKEINPEPGRRLKELIKASGIPQKKFAEIIGYTEQHLSLIVTGNRNLTIEAAKNIAQMMNVRVEWLMGLDNYMTQHDIDVVPLVHEMDVRNGSRGAMQILANLAGYEIATENHSGKRCYSVVLNSNGCRLEQMDLVYIISKGGKEIGRCNDSRYHALAKEVAEFAEFKLQKLCNELVEERDG